MSNPRPVIKLKYIYGDCRPAMMIDDDYRQPSYQSLYECKLQVFLNIYLILKAAVMQK